MSKCPTGYVRYKSNSPYSVKVNNKCCQKKKKRKQRQNNTKH